MLSQRVEKIVIRSPLNAVTTYYIYNKYPCQEHITLRIIHLSYFRFISYIHRLQMYIKYRYIKMIVKTIRKTITKTITLLQHCYYQIVNITRAAKEYVSNHFSINGIITEIYDN